MTFIEDTYDEEEAPAPANPLRAVAMAAALVVASFAGAAYGEIASGDPVTLAD